MAVLTCLLATGNQGKIKELRELASNLNLKLSDLKSSGIQADSPETGSSFLENAQQKALFYFQKSRMPVLADDSGLEVDALGGAPGIHSARFGGFPNHREKRAYLLDLLQDVEQAYRTARFYCSAVYYDGSHFYNAEATHEGFIGLAEKGSGGFGYDSIFYSQWDGPSNAEMEPEHKNRVSHRGQAFRKLFATLIRNGVFVKK